MKNIKKTLICYYLFIITTPIFINAQIVPLDGRGGGIIAFYSERDGNSEIYIMNADGSTETRLTQNSTKDFGPDISPDGSQIVFISNRDGNDEIYKMNSDGSNITRLTNTNYQEAYPFWSSDNSKIIYGQNQNGNWEVFVMNADGSNQTRITNTAGNEEWAHLSPDMSRIVYATGSFPNYDIYIMNNDGSNPSPLVTLPNAQAFPKWSPDGETIAHNYGIFSNNNFTGDIYLVNADGTNSRKITDSGGNCIIEDPYWSPDGSRIVYQSNCSGNFQIYVIDADGNNQTRLTNHAGNDYWPSWATYTQVGVEDKKKAITRFNLYQNYPNPFNPTTTIRYDLPRSTNVVLKIYNTLGQEVKTLVNEYQTSGSKSVVWDGTDNSGETVNSGDYLYRIQTSNLDVSYQCKKMVMLK